MITSKMTPADGVFSCLRMLEDGDKIELFLEAYSNGREQGYALINYTFDTMAVFANDRYGDMIAVYVGSTLDFDNHNIPNDKVFEHRYIFTMEQVMDAARFIYDHLASKP